MITRARLTTSTALGLVGLHRIAAPPARSIVQLGEGFGVSLAVSDPLMAGPS